MLKSLCLALLAVSLMSACSPPQLGSGNGSGRVSLNIGDHCYPGRQMNNTACLPLADVSEVSQVDRDFIYPDPYTSTNFPAGFIAEYYEAPLRVLELSNAGSLSLSANFTANELLGVRSGQFGLFSTRTLTALQQMRQQAGAPFIVTSGFRSPGHNSTVDGSAAWSRHMYGDGVDFYSTRLSLRALRSLCLRFGASYTQLYQGHVHCDWRYDARDTAFFRPVGELPLARHVDLHSTLQAKARLNVAKIQNEFTFTVLGVIKEDDHGVLLHEWHLETP